MKGAASRLAPMSHLTTDAISYLAVRPEVDTPWTSGAWANRHKKEQRSDPKYTAFLRPVVTELLIVIEKAIVDLLFDSLPSLP